MIQPRPPAPPADLGMEGSQSPQRLMFLAGFAAGLNASTYLEGMREGWRRRVEHERAGWQHMAATIRGVAKGRGLTYAEQHAPQASYVPRDHVPTYAECMATWDQPARTAVA